MKPRVACVPAPAGAVVGYVPGVFDMFHIGHLRILERSAELCDYLVAGVVSDGVAEAMKGRMPIVPLGERLEIVRSIACVDCAVEDLSANKSVAWREVGFHRIFKGDDWRGTDKGDQLAVQMAELGVELVYLPYTATVSTSELRRRVANRELE